MSHVYLLSAILLGPLARTPLTAPAPADAPVPANQPIPIFATTGLPCPRGAFTPDSRLLAFDADSLELPTQCQPLAFWPDHSIKWMLVTVRLADHHHRIDLRPSPATSQSPASHPAASQPASPAICITPADTGYLVDTGPLRFRVSPQTAGFLADLVLLSPDGKQIPLLRATNQRLWQLDYHIADSPSPSDTHSLLPPGRIDPSELRIDQVAIERPGPLWATFLLRGRYLHQKLGKSLPGRPDTPSAVDIRLHAFAGTSYMIIEHTFVYEGNPDTDFLASAGLTIPLDIRSIDRRGIIALPSRPGIQCCPPLAPQTQPASHTPWYRAGLLQDSFDHYTTWKLFTPNTRPLVEHHSAPSAGWIDLSDDAWGCAVGILDMAENYPAALEASTRPAAVTAWLYPPQAPPADLRCSMSPNESPPGRATGLSKTHRLWVYFHQGHAHQAQVARLAEAIASPSLLALDPHHIAATGVLGPYRAADVAAFPKLERFAREATDSLLAHQHHSRQYGLFNYGDIQITHWNNDTHLTSLALLWHYLRTSQPRYLHAASAMVTHVRDIDVKHTTAYPYGPSGGPCQYLDLCGFGHPPGTDHWSSAPLAPHVANPIAWRLHYYLTGDSRTKDCIDEVYQAGIVRDKVWSHCDTLPTALYALYARYEMTSHPQYRRKIEAFLNRYCDYALDHGHFPIETPWDFGEDAPAGPFTGQSHTSCLWHSYGLPNFLIEWQALTKDPKLAQALINQAQATLDITGPQADCCHLQILAAGYRLTGRKVFLQRIADMLAECTAHPPVVPPGDPATFAPNTLPRPHTFSRTAAVMSALPYVLGALPDETLLSREPPAADPNSASKPVDLSQFQGEDNARPTP